MRFRTALGRVPALPLVVALLAGCVYYNGMYNTNRLVRSARKAEREGRPFEAKSLWGQVITRAESVAVRHPRSKYAVQATVLRGLAMSRLGQCGTAVEPLSDLSLLPPGDLAEEATLALGRCRLESGDAASADLAFSPLLESKDPRRRAEARFQHARALRMTGHYDEAASLLRAVKSPGAGDELLLALAGAGRQAETDSLTDLLIASRDSTRKWDSLVAIVGRENPASAGRLVDRLGARAGAAPEVVSRRLYEDGLRSEAADTARAVARFREAVRAGAATESGERAALRLLRLDLARADGSEALGPPADSLRLLASRATVVNAEAGHLFAIVSRVRAAADSGAPDVPQGDLRLFLGAEVARDTLAAPRVAGELFRRIVTEWPDSPYAPKALLAVGQVDSTWADSAQVLLAERYGDSPYLAVLRGEAAEGYRELEDSLLAFAAAAPAARPTLPGVRRRPPIAPNQPPGVRRRPREPDLPDDAAGGRRVVQ